MKKVNKYSLSFFGSLVVLLLIIPLSGCDRVSQSALVWTDVPELVIAAQLFNKENDQFAVDVEYKANPASEMKKTNKPPSLVVAKYFFRTLDKNFDSLNDLFQNILDPK